MRKKNNIPTSRNNNSDNSNANLEKRIMSAISHYSGPIPQPEAMAKYENIQTGFADRILTMAEKVNDARIENEKELIKSDKFSRIRGQSFAFTIAILGMLLGGFLIYNDKNIAGLVTLIGTAIVPMISIFVTGRRKKPTNTPESPS